MILGSVFLCGVSALLPCLLREGIPLGFGRGISFLSLLGCFKASDEPAQAQVNTFLLLAFYLCLFGLSEVYLPSLRINSDDFPHLWALWGAAWFPSAPLPCLNYRSLSLFRLSGTSQRKVSNFIALTSEQVMNWTQGWSAPHFSLREDNYAELVTLCVTLTRGTPKPPYGTSLSRLR